MLKKIILTSLTTLVLSSCNNTITTVSIPEEPVKDSVVVKLTNYFSIFIDYYSENKNLNCITTKDTLFVKIPYNSTIGFSSNKIYYTVIGVKDTIINL
jgi:hypothetical protein